MAVFACGSDSDSERPPAHEQAELPDGGRAPPLQHYEDDTEPRWGDECRVGVTYVIEGRQVFVPAACDRHWRDFGDPPPDPLGVI